ncbi:cellulose biosynthesis protein BcsP [Paraburkholderia madseniana]|uniref:Cellulose biosynthesis protein BcsP n=1 Tax=Paraburkholderia madseniana TaxID=2599607 RepID=A0AAP5B960_9BURK|nr:MULTISPECIES: cellulose biosynthesis protein BcsP [Paraburkholderia]MCX4144382.1 cellulose biosynthesis protein BcsP [Paraburkholderia madseniana]MDN7147335.1 cellulose biosynthesis protein BcsP [Paraburkholderia sp. WS6]MDQ6406215.1 cellulose biosynthesis protein BcsP [Paraburkholderia madseniana]
MSSSSDIEKLFDHFGGDASAYQEIGRENEARSARTRWPLLVTLDLTQPAIPAIGQRRELAGEASALEAAPEVDRQDTTPKDAASVTRAKAPLFARSHRRDIPPVVVAAHVGAPRGASRFGAFETKGDAAAPAAQTTPAAARVDVATQAAVAVAPAQGKPVATAPVPPVMPAVSIPPVTQFRRPATPVSQPTASMSSAAVMARAEIPALTPRATAPAPVSASTPTWAQAPAPVPAWAQAPAQAHTPTWAQAPAPTYTTAPAAPKPPGSILGKLFAPAFEPTPPQPTAPTGETAPLQSVFDRLRGTPAQTAPAPARAASAAAPAASNSWLINGPRRS